MIDIVIRDDSIRLGQFLKVAQVAATGGEAKVRIQSGEVKVNGTIELRRGRKLQPGDAVEIDGELFRVSRS